MRQRSIAFAALAAACLGVGCARPSRAAADLVVTNATVWTGNRSEEGVRAIAIVGDRIVALGSVSDVDSWRAPATRVVDAGGHRVVPGFNDAHVHFVAGGMDLDNIDLVLLGIKSWDRERHRALTGRDNAPTLELARRLAARKLPVWVRFVLVPGLTDDPDDIAQIAAFAAELGNVERVEVLPFHQMGRFKWEKLKLEYKLNDVQPPPRATVEAAIAKFRAVGLEAC